LSKFDTVIRLHLGNYDLEVKRSNVHGEGLFSRSFFSKETEMGPCLIHKSRKHDFEKYLGEQYNLNLKWDYIQTNATRFINHSPNPNLKIYKSDPFDGIIYSKFLCDVQSGDEITLNYLETAILSEDCTDPHVVEYYCEILKLSKSDFLSAILKHK
jgi:hypothetical protein